MTGLLLLAALLLLAVFLQDGLDRRTYSTYVF